MEALKNQVSEVFALQREYFLNYMKSAPLSVRKTKLKELKKWILTHEDDICEAMLILRNHTSRLKLQKYFQQSRPYDMRCKTWKTGPRLIP